MNFRQIHLDFHTSEKIDGIGSGFSKEQFQSALKLGHVNSITVFSKCHHGWAYHPSDANEMHPGLNFDLLGAQIEAAHEIGVKTPVYLSAGFDEKMARRHPEWLRMDRNNTPSSWDRPGYHEFCMNTPYLDYLIAQVEEVVRNYDCDGIFLDIVGVRQCYCQKCVSDLLAEGKDPYDEKNVTEFGERIYKNYTTRIREAVDRIKPGLPVFHNSGHIRRGRRDLADVDTHLELESLPTGGWGYDHFPLSAAYSRTLGKEFLGMTGKFHLTWGGFGEFKHPNALRYEEALCTANGAKCSIGDQAHPDCHMEEATYALIGEAYKEIEEREEWLDNVESVADIAVFSAEAAANYYQLKGEHCEIRNTADAGVVRILLEGKYLFDVVDADADLGKYKLLILPDIVKLDGYLTEKVQKFAAAGGKILATGLSGLDKEDNFAVDLGCDFGGKSEFTPSYFIPQFDVGCLRNTSFVIYPQSYNITAHDDAKVTMKREDPYFNRTTFAFSSHRHTPNDKSVDYPAATIGENGGYIASELFWGYAEYGDLITKLLVQHMIDEILGENKTLTTNLPAQGVVTLMDQKAESRLVNHVLYASPVKRGANVEVIEDIIPLYGIDVSLRLDRGPKKVYFAPERADIPYKYENGVLSYTIDKLDMRAMVVIDY